MKASQARITSDPVELDLMTGLQITRRMAVAEVLCMVLVVELIEWVVPLMGNNPTAYGGLALVIATLMAVCYLRDRPSARQLGVRVDNFIPAMTELWLFLIVFILAVLSIGLVFGSIRLGERFWSMLAVVPPWALLQQYMLFAFAGFRLRVLFGEGEAGALATAGLFAALHLPNPTLTLVCAVGAYVWARVYARRPNLFANALTHTVASAFLANTLPHWMLKNMVVGYNHFFR